MALLTREEIPSALLEAKNRAVKDFLKAKAPAPRADVAFIASARAEENVVGVGIGQKIVRGKPTAKTAIRFYVHRKIGRKALTEALLLPAEIGGVLTDVVETGRFRAFPATAVARKGAVPVEQRRARPARPGCSVGFQDPANRFVMAGTFGAVVAKDGRWHILSNNHVLADENRLARGAPIFQPGLLDHGDAANDQIAQLTDFVALAKGKANHVDCAIAEVLPGAAGRKLVSPTFLPRVGKLKSGEALAAQEKMAVMKVGRTTGFTTGTIRDVTADVRIQYDTGSFVFADQILVVGDAGAFSAGGDSGSLVVHRTRKQPVGLLFAGSESHTILNPIRLVLEQLGVTIVV
jgi:hypothetical protein